MKSISFSLKSNVITSILLTLFLSVYSSAATLHLILLGNTSSSMRPNASESASAGTVSRFGEAVAADLALVEAAIKSGLPKRHTLKVVNLSKPKASTNFELSEALRGVIVTKGDSILVYYSGHGGYMNDQDRDQVFDLSIDGKGGRETLIRRQQIVDALSRDPGTIQVLAVISDCCYLEFPFTSRMPCTGGLEETYSPITVNDPPTLLIESLFFNANGYIHMTSARPDQAAYFRDEVSKPGGIFTTTFADTLEVHRGESLSWDQFFHECRKGTALAFDQMREQAQISQRLIPPNRVQNVLQETQTPWVFANSTLGTSAPQGRIGIYLTETATVDEVRPDSPAAVAGISRNDRFLSINNHPIAPPNAKSMAENAIRNAPLTMKALIVRESIGGTDAPREVTVQFEY